MGFGVLQKGNVWWERWLTCNGPTSTSGGQIFGSFVGSPPGLPAGLEAPADRVSSPSSPEAEPPARRPASNGRLAPRPPGPQGGAREAAAKGLRLPRPALAAAGAPGSRLQTPDPPRPHSAPLAATAASPVLATATFIFLNYIGRKAKAKTAERRARSRARSEHRERAGSQRRGLGAARGPPSGVGAGATSTREAGAGQQAGRPDSKRTGPHASVCRDASPGPDCWSPFVGFWPGSWEQASEGYRLEVLSELGQVWLTDPQGSAWLPGAGTGAGPSAKLRSSTSSSLIVA